VKRLVPIILMLGAGACGSPSRKLHEDSRVVEQTGIPTAAVLGCYRADRALGISARAETGVDAAGLTTFGLLPEGKVDRSAVANQAERIAWGRMSRWVLMGDTLRVRLTNGFAGPDELLHLPARTAYLCRDRSAVCRS
jgi:hypothetical protein